MIIESATPLSAWESYYVIVGSSAAALTGLQFVVMALIADAEKKASADQIDAFGTPNIVHFSMVLLLSAVLSAPWPDLGGVIWLLGLAGFGGIVYVIIVNRRARSQEGYAPVFEDWLWHVILPFSAYGLLLISSFIMGPDARDALFLIAALTLILLFVGIHNAWDTVTYIVTRRSREKSGPPL